MKKPTYVVVFKSTNELYFTPYGGYLPPMTIDDLTRYFNCDIKKQTPVLDNNGIIKSTEDGYGHSDIKLYECMENKRCPHCGRPVVKSDIQKYAAQCFYCDEDFFDCELKNKRLNNEL